MGIQDTREKKEPLVYLARRDLWVLQELRAREEVKGVKDPRELRATWACRDLLEPVG